MKKILTNNIVTPVKQPFIRTSLEWIQSAYTDALNDISNAPTITRQEYFAGGVGQKLYGCYPVNTVGNLYIIPAGAIKYNGEIYHVNSTVETIRSPNVPVCYIVTEYATTDPLELSNGTTYNVHQNKKIVIKSGISGVGGSTNTNYEYLCDFYDLLEVPSLTDVYPTAVEQSDLIIFAETGQTSTTNISITGTSIYVPVNVYNSSINQFNEFIYDASFEVIGTPYLNSGWRLLGNIPSNAIPKNIADDYFVSCVLEEWTSADPSTITTTTQPLKIETGGDMYYNKPAAGGVVRVHVHLRYNV